MLFRDVCDELVVWDAEPWREDLVDAVVQWLRGDFVVVVSR